MKGKIFYIFFIFITVLLKGAISEMVINENFENLEIGTLPIKWGKYVPSGVTDVKVTSEISIGQKSLLFLSSSLKKESIDPLLEVNFSPIERPVKFSFDFYVENPNTEFIFQLRGKGINGPFICIGDSGMLSAFDPIKGFKKLEKLIIKEWGHIEINVPKDGKIYDIIITQNEQKNTYNNLTGQVPKCL